jgi:hypothetical protein
MLGPASRATRNLTARSSIGELQLVTVECRHLNCISEGRVIPAVLGLNAAMLTTIGDVKSVARSVWPSAVELNVQLVTAADNLPEGYRVTAFGDHHRLLGRSMAPTLGKLKQQLEHQLASRKTTLRELPTEELPISDVMPPAQVSQPS